MKDQLFKVGTEILPHDLSVWGMFLAADWVVKTIMIGLAITSLLTWTVLMAKSIEFYALKRQLSLSKPPKRSCCYQRNYQTKKAAKRESKNALCLACPVLKLIRLER